MKYFLRLTLTTFLFIVFGINLKAQLTKLANNNNIQTGIPLTTVGVLVDENGALWKTDGNSAGTKLYTNKILVDTPAPILVKMNNQIFFTGTSTEGDELWLTDGTDAGTHIVKDIEVGAGSSSPKKLYVFKNMLYFFAKTTDAGIELWKTDGTTSGTTMVKDINPGAGDSYSIYTNFYSDDSTLFFTADDGTHGVELWKTDGSENGTTIIKDINVGAGSSRPGQLTPLNNKMVFEAYDGTNSNEIWQTDGTEAGTELIQIVGNNSFSIPQSFVPLNDKILFLMTSSFPFQYLLYATDGTSTGTNLLASFSNYYIYLTNSVIINNKLFFAANTTATGSELWTTDGTSAGTNIFLDINPGSSSSGAFILPDYAQARYYGGDFRTKLFNGKVFFYANDGTHGNELWLTDGTVSGTQIVKDINSGVGSSILSNINSTFSWFYTSDQFYFSANDGTTGNELFKTDGSAASTVLVKDINAGIANSNPIMFMFFDNHIYITADDGDNVQDSTDLYLINASVTLPVSLIDFTATTDGKIVYLQWSTATEKSVKNFVVRRSVDAVHFANIGTENAKGNSNSKTNYYFTDGSALSTGTEKLYYRLQMVDNDGTFTDSKIAAVSIPNNKNFFVIYPNPVKDKLVISSNNITSDAIIKITDQSGKIVLTQKLQNVQGTSNTINVTHLSNGVYTLQIISNNNKQTTQFVKY